MESRAVVMLMATLLFFLDYNAEAYDSPAILSTQIDTLLAEYDREVPPLKRNIVSVSLDVRHASVDDTKSTIRMLADLKMSWSDTRLSWNESEWGTDAVTVSAERLWVPDLRLANAAGAGGPGAGAGEASLRARLSSDGTVLWASRLEVAVPVDMQLADWPRDTQHATFKFSSRAYSSDEVDLIVGKDASKPYCDKTAATFETGAWELTSVIGGTAAWRRADGVEVRVASWSVRVRRRGEARALAHGAVLAAALLLLAASAALSPAQRPPLAAAAAFIAALWLITAIFHLPNASSTPRIMSLMCAVCVCGAASGAGAALAGRVSRCAAPPPAALRALLARVSALHIVTDPESCASSKSGAWAAAARLLDLLLGAALALTLLVLASIHLFSGPSSAAAGC